MRGEKAKVPQCASSTRGSPPRARGEVLGKGLYKGTGRITPACAGRSGCRCSAGAPASDHPRVRGEKYRETEKKSRTSGSPPRARGEALPFGARPARRWITPACAGRRLVKPLLNLLVRDHPRVRGEKMAVSLKLRSGCGSPPRARGEEFIPEVRRKSAGITPACAGRSRCCAGTRSVYRDHPRVRGEKTVPWI